MPVGPKVPGQLSVAGEVVPGAEMWLSPRVLVLSWMVPMHKTFSYILVIGMQIQHGIYEEQLGFFLAMFDWRLPLDLTFPNDFHCVSGIGIDGKVGSQIVRNVRRNSESCL